MPASACLRQFYRLGVRNLGLAWNFRNAACDGVSESRTNGGLTQFGVKVVEECNRLGMLIDLSHLSPAGVDDVLNTSLQPVIASHSNARALCDHPRNLTDAQLEAIAMRGGVVGVTFVDAFLNARNPSRATLDDVITHLEYMLSRIGPDSVALGSDFDGCTTPSDIPDVTAYPRITTKLLDRGHSPEVVRKVLGGNLLRVFSIGLRGVVYTWIRWIPGLPRLYTPRLHMRENPLITANRGSDATNQEAWGLTSRSPKRVMPDANPVNPLPEVRDADTPPAVARRTNR